MKDVKRVKETLLVFKTESSYMPFTSFTPSCPETSAFP